MYRTLLAGRPLNHVKWMESLANSNEK